jgi:hypothetical protein
MSVMGLGDSSDYQEALNTSFTVYVTIDGVLQREGKLMKPILQKRAARSFDDFEVNGAINFSVAESGISATVALIIEI